MWLSPVADAPPHVWGLIGTCLGPRDEEGAWIDIKTQNYYISITLLLTLYERSNSTIIY